MSILSRKEFHDEQAVYKYVQARIWAQGPVCPHCGEKERIGELKGKSTRIGVRKCYKCRKPFTVKAGTIFESSHVKMHLWLQAIYLMFASKKGISSNQLHRVLGVTLKTAWFMSHRIREAMRSGDLDPMGGAGKAVEADETYFGYKDDKSKGKRTKRGKRGHSGQRAVVALVERGGNVRSFYVERADKKSITEIVASNLDRESALNTDESRLYDDVSEVFAKHQRVRHTAGEYVRGDAHTNTVEGVFGVLKRGMRGTYQHCKEKHLHRYLAEFDFRYNNRVTLGVNDEERVENPLLSVVGKPLRYSDPIYL